MLQLIGRKALGLVPVILAASFITFMMMSLLPGDPALGRINIENLTPEELDRARDELGLNDPLPVRYATWLGDAVRGDLGRSLISNQEVTELIRQRFPVTLQIMVMTVTFSVGVAIPLGVISAYRAGSYFDRITSAVTFGFLSIPNFVLALVLIIIVAVELGLLPATGWTRFTTNPWESIKSGMLPAITLGLSAVATFTRLLRTDMIGTLQEDHVAMAKAKGLTTGRILFRHALRPSSFSLMTIVGLQMATLLSGAVVAEEIFALPGLGRALFRAVQERDFIVVQGLVLLLAVIYVVVNFIIDILYSFLDPRIRHGQLKR
ncbi:MAG: ABC transporter permease [Acidimicrobiales bacterium]